MSDYTIIITSYNRPKTLLRTLKFLFDCDNSVQVIIADSSKKILDDKELKIFIDLKKIELKFFSENIKVAEKISQTLEIVNTSYTVLCADDDFIYPDSIKKCIHFLKQNSDYVSCHGKYYVHTNAHVTRETGVVFRNLTKELISADDENPKDRVKKYIDGKLKQQYTFYAVMKTSDLSDVWKQTFEFGNDWYILEYVSTIICLLKGKMKTLPIFYMSREPNHSTWTVENRIINIFNTKTIFEVSSGLARYSALKQKVNDIDQEIKFFVKFFNTKKNNIIKKAKPIEINQNFKSILRFFIYPLKKILFKISNELPFTKVKKIEELILEMKEVQSEIQYTRKKY